MIFSTLISIKENSKRNIFFRLRYKFLVLKIAKMLRKITEHVITYDILLNFSQFASIMNNREYSGIGGLDIFSTDGKYLGSDIYLDKEQYGSAIIMLRPDDRSIEVKYPINIKENVNFIYNEEINRDPPIDPTTKFISNAIAERIYIYLMAYMKGEYDNVNQDRRK